MVSGSSPASGSSWPAVAAAAEWRPAISGTVTGGYKHTHGHADLKVNSKVVVNIMGCLTTVAFSDFHLRFISARFVFYSNKVYFILF